MLLELQHFDADSQAVIAKAQATGGGVLDLAGVLFFDHDLPQRAVVASCCGDLYQIKRRLQLKKHETATHHALTEALIPLASATPPTQKLSVEDLMRIVVTHPALEKDIFAKSGVTWQLLLDSLPRARLQCERYAKIEGMGLSQSQPSSSKQNAQARASSNSGKSLLRKYGIEMVSQASMFDPVVGRQHLLDRIVNILSRKNKRNPCLVGHPGVGKTALVEGVAKRIAEVI